MTESSVPDHISSASNQSDDSADLSCRETRGRRGGRTFRPPYQRRRAPPTARRSSIHRRRSRSRRSSTPRSGRACAVKKDRRRRSRSRSCRPTRRAIRCCSQRSCRSRRRCCRRSRPPSNGRAFTLACGATARTFSCGARRARCRPSAWSSRSSRPGCIVVKHRSRAVRQVRQRRRARGRSDQDRR